MVWVPPSGSVPHRHLAAKGTQQVRKKREAELIKVNKAHNAYANTFSKQAKCYSLHKSSCRANRPSDPLDSGAENFSYKPNLRTKLDGLMQGILNEKTNPYLLEGKYIP
eukprot:m.145479 g.145479  ORF g.145479 m.145479 type:complete len:109 (-) comp17734_c0_seq6:1588-1914(-)